MNKLNSDDSDEDDFMSDKFLLPNPTTIPQFGIRNHNGGSAGGGGGCGGGLIKDRKLKRKLEIEEQRKKSNKKSIAVMEKEQLELGLSTAINPSDKIYKMMGKMGYKPGQSLGKESSSSSSSVNSTAIIEPIGIQIKTDRYGFGRRETAMERLQEYRYQIACKNKQQSSSGNQCIDTFRKNLINKSNTKLMECDLRRCQLTCEGLDAKNNIKIPDMKFFWPNRKKDNDSENEATADAADDHVVADDAKARVINDEDEGVDDESVDEEEYELYDQLEMLVHYLRNAYLYCYWCAIQYTDDMDLKNNCPGPRKDDHDLD